VATRFFPVVEAGPYCFQYVATVIPYFLLGAALSEKDLLAIRVPLRISLAVTLVAVFFLIALDCCSEWRVPHVVDSQEFRAFLCTVMAWFAYDALPMSKKNVNLLKYAFFIYLVHVSMIRFGGNVFRVAFDPKDPYVRLVGYVANMQVFFIALGIGWFCERFLPKVYHLLSGGR
jgi:peptidoglycan/LPS O-acetylase OafA/YrhL